MITIKKLSDEMKRFAPPFKPPTNEVAYFTLRNLLIASLSKQEQRAYEFVAWRSPVESRELDGYLGGGYSVCLYRSEAFVRLWSLESLEGC